MHIRTSPFVIGVTHTAHDTKCGPHLPHHREGAADVLWRRLSSIDGCCARLGADGESESETSNEEVWPVVRSGHPDAGDS